MGVIEACCAWPQEPGRLFCPHCGNATLDKVELTIGPDGSEQYGVRKRFNLRGTRFSLPKPKVLLQLWLTCNLIRPCMQGTAVQEHCVLVLMSDAMGTACVSTGGQ